MIRQNLRTVVKWRYQKFLYMKRSMPWNQWHETSGLPLKRFFNTSGNLYKELRLKDRLPGMSEDEQYQLLSTDGMLVKRPLLVTENGVCPGFDQERWERLLGAE